ncbi:hypothetical protein P170DRAFT_470436 [Aspergillus steynii IBT 23096]|uniref:Uncharacterized protein n=1 Tax=Aspergillus steynii IBT 23096 TaxID=1392250 RepID=A0A2I2GQ48_9EURO|nr:uncharacterized protein P170DRAFT_470436 [Aspergillus steynii IBT 23096]PLB55007.1 hypothetical protein P170DRAFT_470436 [Aspergillus steynii IBT 23096]
MDPKPVQPPNFHNLEISGSWDGEFEGPVKLRISLDVQSAPDTELRLLDTKASAIFLKTASARVLSDESNDNSSLFAFPISNSDKLKGGRRFSAERPPKSEDALSASPDGPPLPSRSLMKELRTYQDTVSAKFSDLCVNVAEYEDLTHSPQLMKRSAADACFTNSEVASDGTPTHKRQASSNETDKTLSSFSKLGEGSIKSGKLLGLKAWLETAAQPHEDRELADTGEDELRPEEVNSDNCETAIGDVTNTKDTCGLSTPVVESPNTPPRQETPTMEKLCSTPDPQAHTPYDQESIPSGLSASPNLSLLFSTPKQSNSKPGTWEKHYLIEETTEDDDGIAIEPLIEFSWTDPKLILSNGDLIVKFSSKTREASYRIDVNLTVYVDDDYVKGWSTILLPGLPRLQAGETGSFLFLLPEDRGLEFRTKYMQRCTMMEDCFFAEFTSVRNLIISMRVCGRKFYGFLKNFIVDQEVIAHHAVVNSEAESDESISYHAMCSLKLSQRYLCSDKCGFSFYVDGGPDGFFICKLEHQKAGLPMIKIPSGDSASAGTSRVQVICSPKDLGMFCLTWSIPSADRHAVHWLPRIYPASPRYLKGSRDHLRDTFTELSSRGLFEVTGDKTKQLAREEIDADKENHASDKKATFGPDPFSPDHYEAPDALILFRLLMSTLGAKILQHTKGCIVTAMSFISRPYQWILSRMKHLMLALGSACVLLGVVWLFVRDAGFGVLSSVQNLSDPLDLSKMCGGNGTMVENVSACLDDSIFKEDPSTIITPGGTVELNFIEADSDNQMERPVRESTDGDNGDAEANLGDNKAAELLSFRDRIDHWLGWKGPVNRRS